MKQLRVAQLLFLMCFSVLHAPQTAVKFLYVIIDLTIVNSSMSGTFRTSSILKNKKFGTEQNNRREEGIQKHKKHPHIFSAQLIYQTRITFFNKRLKDFFFSNNVSFLLSGPGGLINLPYIHYLCRLSHSRYIV